MQHISTRIHLGGAVLLLCLTAPVAFADQVKMNIKDSPLGLYHWKGENVSPYSAEIIKVKVNGKWVTASTLLSVVCLDIAENVGLNAGFEYTTTPDGGGTYLPGLPPAPSMQQRYNGAARLAAQLIAEPAQNDLRGMRSFAVWYIFNEHALDAVALNSYRDQIKQMASDAIASTTSVHYTVYTPGYTTSTNPPGLDLRSQRFIGNVTVPEPSAVALLGLDMSGLVGLIVVLRRRFRRPE